jgi:hypothetical protein
LALGSHLRHPLQVLKLWVTTAVKPPEHWHDCRSAEEALESGQGQHRLVRSSGPNWPSAHSVQAAEEIAPDPVCTVPLAQEAQADSEDWAIRGWYFPGEQRVHADAPPWDWYVPLPHRRQSEASPMPV